MEKSPSAVILRDVEKKVNNIPPFSPVIVEALALLDSPKSSAHDIQKVMQSDPVLAARVLRMANSAYYGYSGKISTLTQAVVVLGLNTMRAILVTAYAQKTLDQQLPGYGYSSGKFWEHSVLSALGAKHLSKTIRTKNSEEAFVGGLLHDIGKLIMDPFLKKETLKFRALTENQGVPEEEAELNIFGTNHSLIGKRIAQAWNFPSLLVECIATHHSPEDAVGHQHVSAIIGTASLASLDILQLNRGPVYADRQPPLLFLKFALADYLDLKEAMEKAVVQANGFLHRLGGKIH